MEYLILSNLLNGFFLLTLIVLFIKLIRKVTPMGEALDKLVEFGQEMNNATNEIAADIETILANQGDTVNTAQLVEVLGPKIQALKDLAAQYPVQP